MRLNGNRHFKLLARSLMCLNKWINWIDYAISQGESRVGIGPEPGRISATGKFCFWEHVIVPRNVPSGPEASICVWLADVCREMSPIATPTKMDFKQFMVRSFSIVIDMHRHVFLVAGASLVYRIMGDQNVLTTPLMSIRHYLRLAFYRFISIKIG